MSYKRILTIQDISCFGQCSLTVALPILSACGIETCVLPSTVLSTHTGGFKGYTFRDLTEDIPEIQKHWVKEKIKFDAFYTGYLGSVKQIEYVKNMFDATGNPDSIRVVDPVIGDYGKLYAGFDDKFIDAMKDLCRSADYILPNITEACLLTGTEYKEEYDESYIDELLSKLESSFKATIILTGACCFDNKTGIAIHKKGNKTYYQHKKIAGSYHGTGDIFASAFSGALLNGKSEYNSAKIAADYTLECIQATTDAQEHWYGTRFELALGKLIDSLKEVGN